MVELEISDADAARMSGGAVTAAPVAQPVPVLTADPELAIADKVAPRVAEAQALVVVNQAGLDAVGERLAVNKALQAEVGEAWDKPIKDAHKLHADLIAKRKKYLDPLLAEESILKRVGTAYVVEQRRLADDRARVEREAREAEERRLFAEAEVRRQVEEARANELLAQEHAEQVERDLLAAEQAGAGQDVIDALVNSPAPEPVVIQMEVPELPPVPKAAPAVAMPKGFSVRETFHAEVTNLALLCRAISEGKVPANYVTANMTALNARARADKRGMDVPGVKAVPDNSATQRRV